MNRFHLLGVILLLVIGTVGCENAENGAVEPGPANQPVSEVDTAAEDSLAPQPDTSSSDEPTGFTVDVALLDYPASGGRYAKESDGEQRGCDRVVLVDRSVSRTDAPLTAALNELFSLEQRNVKGWQNFIAETNETLSFERATIEDSTAHVYLAGELSGLAGVCDNPRAKIQIEETALNFPTVDSVALYLNGEPTDLQPDGRGEEERN